MRINRIENNTNFNAKLNIISNSELLLKKDIATLTSKAHNLGSKKDFITVGITEVTREKKEGKIAKINRLLHRKTIECYTNISGACHSFFDIEAPCSFMTNLGEAFGGKKERAKKSYEIINKYLDDIQFGLEHKSNTH